MASTSAVPAVYLTPPAERCPVNLLPNELLSYIFELGTLAQSVTWDEQPSEDEWETDSESDASMSEIGPDVEVLDVKSDDEDGGDNVSFGSRPPYFEVLVSHICQKWRECALSTPTLWTHIEFKDQRQPFREIEVRLQRSSGAPLDIHLDSELDDADGDDAPSDWSDAEFKLALSLVAPHIGRWRAFNMHVLEYSQMHDACARMAQAPGAPLLESMQLTVHDDIDEADNFQPASLREPRFVLFSGHAPRLREVSFWGVHVDWARSASYLSGLLDLELTFHANDVRPTFKELATILHSCPEMHTLALCRSGPAGYTHGEWYDTFSKEEVLAAAEAKDNETDSIVTLRLPALRDLNIAWHDPEYATLLLNHLSLPSLTGLTVDYHDDEFTAFTKALISHRSRPVHGEGERRLLRELEELKISSLNCDDATAALFLSQLTNLRVLQLNFNWITSLWLTLLANKPGNATLVPQPHDIDHTGEFDNPTAGSLDSCDDARPTLDAGAFAPRLEKFWAIGLTGEQIRWFVERRKVLGASLREVYVDNDAELDDEDQKWLRKNLEKFGYFENSEDEEEDDDDDLVVDIDDDSEEEEEEEEEEEDAEDTDSDLG